jgi:ketosteroid isomerase-like protein
MRIVPQSLAAPLAASLAAMTAATPASAGDADDAAASVRRFVDGFNAGDVESALAACAASAHIIDEFPPIAWSGEGACAVWANDYAADVEKKGITENVVTLREAKHVFVDGDHAYVVAPVDYFYKVGGKRRGQKNSTLTVALERKDGGWKITGWAWAQGKPVK